MTNFNDNFCLWSLFFFLVSEFFWVFFSFPGPTNYCFSTVDGSCVKHESVVNSASSKWQDLIAPGLSKDSTYSETCEQTLN